MPLRSRHYRRSLGRHIGKEVTLECNTFRMASKNDDGSIYAILERPKIVRLSGQRISKDWLINHLWIQIPEGKADYFLRYYPLIRKVRITGFVEEYRYEKSGKLQAGVKLRSIEILKYRKDIAKKYNLNPGHLLPRSEMDRILKAENFSENVFQL